MLSGVYKIQSIIKPNKIYIGSSINIMKRLAGHISDLKNNRHINSKIQNHFNKYGLVDFSFSILIECNIDDLIKLEQYFIDFYNPSFNICRNAGNTIGYKHSEETKNKMRKPKTDEHKLKLSLAKKGKKTGRPPINGGFKKGYTPWNKGKKMNKKKNVSKA